MLQVVYFTAIFPYVMLIVLLIRGVMLEGYTEGIKFYMSADTSRLTDASVWKDAHLATHGCQCVERCCRSNLLLSVSVMGWADCAVQL